MTAAELALETRAEMPEVATARKEILKADKSIADRKKYWNYTEQMDNTLCQKEAILSQPIRTEQKNVAV